LPNYKLRKCIKNQIRYSSIVIIIGRLATSYSEWINFEIDTAYDMNKYIILIKPWGNVNLPLNAQIKASKIINWNKNSLITTIKEYS